MEILMPILGDQFGDMNEDILINNILGFLSAKTCLTIDEYKYPKPKIYFLLDLLSENLIWWFNGVGQLVLGILGFIASSVSFSILTRKELASTFNYLLAALALSDNLHYICSLGMAIMHLTPGSRSVRGTYFPQFHSIFFMISFYTFLALVTERLIALSKYRRSTGTLQRLDRLSPNAWANKIWLFVKMKHHSKMIPE